MKFKKRKASITAIVVVLCVMVSVNYILYNYAQNNHEELISINLSGKQRMLSQKITLDLVLMEEQLKAGDDFSKPPLKESRSELQRLLTHFKEVQEGLQNGSEKWNLPKLENEYIQVLFNLEAPYFHQLYSNADSLINYPDPEKVETRIQTVFDNQKRYLSTQDLITYELEEETQSHLNRLSTKMLILSILSVILILLMIPFVFNPIFKKVQSVNKELKESSEKYHQFYHNTPAMMHSIDQEGKIIHVSNYWLKKMGYTRSEVIGHKSSDFLTPESQKYAQEKVLPDFFKNGSCENVPYEFVTKSGKIIDTILSASSERDKGGDVIRSHAVITDVTLEKKAERALQMSEEKNRALLQANPDVIFRLSGEGNFIDFHASPGVLIMPSETFYNSNIKDILSEDQAEECVTLIQKALESGELQMFYHHINYEGQQYYFEGRIVKNGDNEVLNIVRDITSQKKAELLSSISYDIAMKSSGGDINVEQFCKYTQKELGQLFNTDEFYISQVNGTDKLTFLYISDSSFEGKLPYTRKQGNGLSEYVIQTKEPLLLNNGEVLAFQEKNNLEIYGKPAKSWMGAPLISSGKAIGVIACQSYTEEGLYNENDLNLLSSIGNQIGLWIEKLKVAEDQAGLIQIFEKSLYEVYIFDMDTLHFKYVNRSATENLGYTDDELYQLTPLDVKDGLTEEYCASLLDTLQSNESSTARFEAHHKRKDGTFYPIEVHLQRSVFKGEDVCISTVLDITSRKEAEKGIQEYARFFSLSMELMCIASADGYFKKVNPLFMSTLGYTEKELLENPFHSFIHPEDIEKTSKATQLTANGKKPVSTVNRYRCKNGEYKWISWESSIDKKTGFIFATGRDVTELKNAEMALLKSENSLKEAQRITQLGSWEWDMQSNTVKFSDENYRILDLQKDTEEVTLQVFISKVHPDDQQRVMKTFEHAFQERNSFKITFRIKPEKGNDRDLECRGHVEVDKDNNIVRYYGTCMDVTERVKAEKAKEVFTNQLEEKVEERTEKLVEIQEQLKKALSKEKKLGDMKSNFVSTASHQFRTPMAIIQANSELMTMLIQNTDIEVKDKLERVTGRIEKEIKRMTDLMDDVLILGKITSSAITVDKKPTDILKICDELREQFNGIQQDQRTLNFSYTGEPCEVNIDAKYISHAIVNLISNAFKYSSGENPEMELTYEDTQLKMVISDNGIGIPEEDIDNLFSPFYRAKNTQNVEGTGLGLAISKEYVELNNGEIAVESKLNEGTTFTIHIPYQ